MKKLKTCTLLLVCMTLHCAKPVAQEIETTRTQAVSLVLDQWHRDAAAGNLDAYAGAMTADGVFIGTDASEYWTMPDFSEWCKPYFEKKHTWNFNPLDRNIYFAANGLTAWFDELLDTQMGLCRGSGVLVEQDGRWKIAHYVLSATVPNDLMKQVTAMKSAADSAFGLNLLFAKHGMTGTLLIFDPVKNSYTGHNPALWDSGFLPASTFKIPNTLIGLETGVVTPDYIFKWKGEKRRLPQWERDLTLKDAFQVSCVPCYQEIARKTGPERMKSYLAKMEYPGMDVRKENIDLFWLEGNSRITPRQQAGFLRRLYEEKLPISASVMKTVKGIMLQEETSEYKVSGKTGWAVRNGNNYGWFVGYVETAGRVYYVACLVMPQNQEQPGDFAAARKLIAMEALRYMGIIR